MAESHGISLASIRIEAEKADSNLAKYLQRNKEFEHDTKLIVRSKDKGVANEHGKHLFLN